MQCEYHNGRYVSQQCFNCSTLEQQYTVFLYPHLNLLRYSKKRTGELRMIKLVELITKSKSVRAIFPPRSRLRLGFPLTPAISEDLN